MKEIPIKNAPNALVSDEDYERVAAYHWTALRPRRREDSMYAVTSKRRGGFRVFTKMHRFILDAKPGEIVDHINGNGLDNRRENIRICTASENGLNRRRGKGPRNYCLAFLSKRNRWWARVLIDGEYQSLGTHATQEEARAVCLRALNGE